MAKNDNFGLTPFLVFRYLSYVVHDKFVWYQAEGIYFVPWHNKSFISWQIQLNLLQKDLKHIFSISRN